MLFVVCIFSAFVLAQTVGASSSPWSCFVPHQQQQQQTPAVTTLPTLPGTDANPVAASNARRRPGSYSDSGHSNNTPRSQTVAAIESTTATMRQRTNVESRTSPASNDSSLQPSSRRAALPPQQQQQPHPYLSLHHPAAIGSVPAETTHDEPASSRWQQQQQQQKSAGGRRNVGWSNDVTSGGRSQGHGHQNGGGGGTTSTGGGPLFRARSIGTLTRAFAAETTTTPAASRITYRPIGTAPVTAAASPVRLSTTAAAATSRRPATTTATTRSAGAMVKSRSQPSFRSLLDPYSTGVGRDFVDHRRLRNIDGIEVVDEEDGNEDRAAAFDDDERCCNVDDEDQLTDDDEEDEEETATRQRIVSWIDDMDGIVFERPPSPLIDDDTPPQTDTAIHIVYEGD